jgi:hypothetical protein
MLNVLLEQREEPKAEVVTKKAAYDWRYENSINNGKQPLDMSGNLEHKYSQWRTNSALSNFPDTIDAANKMNTSYHISDKLHYDYLFYSVRKRNRWASAADKAAQKRLEQELELVSLIQQFYKYNVERAKEALKILTSEQIELIKKKQEKGGVK